MYENFEIKFAPGLSSEFDVTDPEAHWETRLETVPFGQEWDGVYTHLRTSDFIPPWVVDAAWGDWNAPLGGDVRKFFGGPPTEGHKVIYHPTNRTKGGSRLWCVMDHFTEVYGKGGPAERRIRKRVLRALAMVSEKNWLRYCASRSTGDTGETESPGLIVKPGEIRSVSPAKPEDISFFLEGGLAWPFRPIVVDYDQAIDGLGRSVVRALQYFEPPASIIRGQ